MDSIGVRWGRQGSPTESDGVLRDTTTSITLCYIILCYVILCYVMLSKYLLIIKWENRCYGAYIIYITPAHGPWALFEDKAQVCDRRAARPMTKSGSVVRPVGCSFPTTTTTTTTTTTLLCHCHRQAPPLSPYSATPTSAWKSGPVRFFIQIWEDRDRDRSSLARNTSKLRPKPSQTGS